MLEGGGGWYVIRGSREGYVINCPPGCGHTQNTKTIASSTARYTGTWQRRAVMAKDTV
jgi:hypothetical protein